MNKEPLDYIDTEFDKMFEDTKKYDGQIVDLKQFKMAKEAKTKDWKPKLV